MLLIAGLSQSMTRNISTLRSIVTRCLAVGVLLCISCVGILGTSALVASSTTADAPGGGAVAEVAVAEGAAFAAVVQHSSLFEDTPSPLSGAQKHLVGSVK